MKTFHFLLSLFSKNFVSCMYFSFHIKIHFFYIFLIPKISSDHIWVGGYFGQPLTYPKFIIFSSGFLCHSLKSSIIYRELFLNCLCVTMCGWSSTPIPPGIVLGLAVVVPLQIACGGACSAAFLRRSPRNFVLCR
jgi:hypothetical protein